MRILSFIVLFFALAAAGVRPAYAIDKAEMDTLSKILALSKDIPAGDVEIVTVYDPSIPKSAADYAQLQQIMAQGINGPSQALKLKGVTASNLDAMTSAHVLLLTGGLTTAQLKAIHQAVGSRKILCTTAEVSYVTNGYCMLGVDVGSNVNIVVNRKNLETSGLRFDSVFQFMVTEI